ncbi:hypothetical protein A11A3_08165 [Alcanivorax hongdengensis A-11-3]|uniref:Porin n=1 Tax=Alcanivorax hongdengensis A-11-3 TaxID=1177179 RepID=L0WCA6_9GAMM|nr:DcaP family trimeric outer membrane transporter [Alcanivorax hongdengensis]EKF74586.1 hypothetical protein A11A3_08165 [Alcanivorax hongdengensis A-11-3]
MGTILLKRSLGAALLLAPVACLADSSFEIYGFGMVDYVQAFDRPNPNWEASLRPGRIPYDQDSVGSPGQAVLSVRQSRLGVNASTLAGDSQLTTKFEFDLYGVGPDEGQTTIRLRHAYGEWKSILAGQTNSVFMDGDVFPNVIDYWGPSGMVFLRNPQIRWTPISGEQTFAVAIETPGSGVDSGNDTTAGDPNTSADNEYPDLTAHYRFGRDWGHVQVAGILRQVGYDTPGGNDGKPEDSDIGWGINLTSVINVMKNDHIRLGVVHGDGISNYMNDGGVDMAPDGNLADPDYQVVPLTGLLAYYEHGWSDTYSTALGYSSTEIDNMDFQTDDAFQKGEYASINLLHAPNDKVLMGVEYLFGKRTAKDDTASYDRRVQFSIKYSFSSGNLL